jgi:hypothetical protein
MAHCRDLIEVFVEMTHGFAIPAVSVALLASINYAAAVGAAE